MRGSGGAVERVRRSASRPSARCVSSAPDCGPASLSTCPLRSNCCLKPRKPCWDPRSDAQGADTRPVAGRLDRAASLPSSELLQ